MNPRKSKLLVVDASICGRNEYPVSKVCRDLLNAILEICHKVILTPEIQKEWNLHQTSFVRQWRRQMNARKKLIIKPISPQDQLKQKINQYTDDPKNLEAMLKDFHLVEASIYANKIILSLDDSARTAFAGVSVNISEIGSVLWLNPKSESFDTIHQWLENGASVKKKWTLGHHEKS